MGVKRAAKAVLQRRGLAAQAVGFPSHAALYHGQGCRGGQAVEVGSSAPSVPLLQEFCRQQSYGSMPGEGM